ncbi:MAG: type II and III secretion system protein [Planctomycetes bacterium]|nr:type II and III secretion system protein [Planctomycetota bacterium]
MAIRFVLATVAMLSLAAMSLAEEKPQRLPIADEDETTVQLQIRFISVEGLLADWIHEEFPGSKSPQGRVLGVKDFRLVVGDAQGDRRTNLYSTPILSLRDGQKITMHSGELQKQVPTADGIARERPAIVTAKEPQRSLGSKLEISANASHDKTSVKVNLRAEIVDRLAEENGFTSIKTTSTPARELVIPNGRTLLLAGGMVAVQWDETDSPVNTGIECFDRLFRTESRVHSQQQVFVLITANIVYEVQDEPVKTHVLDSFAGSLLERKAQADNQTKTIQASFYEFRSRTATTMKLSDIVALSTGGVSDEIILNQARTTGSTFTLTAENILYLKKNKVSDRLVVELQNCRSEKSQNKSRHAQWELP